MWLEHLNILILDDEPRISALLGSILTSFGVRGIRIATDTGQAWAFLRVQGADAVIADRDALAAGRFAFLEDLRANGPEAAASGDTPVIVVTTPNDPSFMAQARAAGANAFLFKPISSRGLHDCLMRVLKQRPCVTMPADGGRTGERRKAERRRTERRTGGRRRDDAPHMDVPGGL